MAVTRKRPPGIAEPAPAPGEPPPSPPSEPPPKTLKFPTAFTVLAAVLADLIASAREIAEASGARITITEDVEEAVHGCDVLLTDVCVSMGESDEVWAGRIELLTPYQVNAATMALTGNPDVKFMHCLPAFHNADTEVGKELERRFGLTALEVTDEVFESPASRPSGRCSSAGCS